MSSGLRSAGLHVVIADGKLMLDNNKLVRF